MKPRSEYIVNEPKPVRPACGPHHVELLFAGDLYRFTGLSDAQLEVVRKRFDSLLLSPDDIVDVSDAATVHFAEGDPADFTPIPDECWEYDMAFDYGPDRVRLAGLGFAAEFDREELTTTAITHQHDAYFVGTFENLFRVLAVYHLAKRGTIVMHSAGIAHDGRGFIFFGRSGAGKTTTCRLLAPLGHEILSDELNAVRQTPDGVELVPMPFAGDFGHDGLSSTPVPLRVIYALEQAPESAVRPCRTSQAIARIVAASPFVNADPFEDDRVFERASALVEAVPVRVLSFPKDPVFWQTVEADVAA